MYASSSIYLSILPCFINSFILSIQHYFPPHFFSSHSLCVAPRVAVVGNVDAGKSTLLGVLTHGELDNGRGTARMKLFRHKHEMETGRTSSVGNDILGFDSQGESEMAVGSGG